MTIDTMVIIIVAVVCALAIAANGMFLWERNRSKNNQRARAQNFNQYGDGG